MQSGHNLSKSLAVVAALLFSSSSVFAQSAPAPTLDPVAQLLAQPAVRVGEVAVAPDALRGYYQSGGARLWTGGSGVLDTAFELASELDALDRDGLAPADYTQFLPLGWQDAADPEELAQVEIGLSSALVKAARDLYGGRTTPSISDPDI
ncbi:MAG: hypothetical protein AAFY73_12845, partial [Pseudomonadota bacterium]